MKRSKFSLSNTHLLSCDMGELIPVGLTEVLPGDSIQQNTTCMVRFAPMLAPVMHPVHVQLAHWFVPHRLVWDDWENFITGGPTGTDASVFPTIPVASAGIGTLTDYFGLPVSIALSVSALPYRGYALIFNEWYRDQDLTTALPIQTTSGVDNITSQQLQNVAWEKDYYTSARPWEQKGPTITLPLGTTAPIVKVADVTVQKVRRIDTDAPVANNTTLESDTAGNIQTTTGSVDVWVDVSTSHVTDLTGASAVTVRALREAMALQRFEEARARFGSRYVEYLRYLGVKSSDARLQRPEFLGGGRYPVQFSEVLQTAEGTDPVGQLAGHGIGVARSNRYRRFFEEHGYIFTLMSVKPKAIYQNGMPRTWNRRTKEDFFQKELQHIGQQAIKNKEVYGAHSLPDGTFGYQDRYDEYRQGESRVCGEFRNTLNFWHFARAFASNPALNDTFIKCVPTEAPFAVPSADVLQVMVKNSIQARRIVASSGKSFIY